MKKKTKTLTCSRRGRSACTHHVKMHSTIQAHTTHVLTSSVIKSLSSCEINAAEEEEVLVRSSRSSSATRCHSLHTTVSIILGSVRIFGYPFCFYLTSPFYAVVCLGD